VSRSPRQTYDRWRRGVSAFQRPTESGFEIVAKSDGPTQVLIFDEIGLWGITSKDFAKELSDVKGPIEVHIDSPGGSAFEGIAIYNTLKQYKGATAVIIDGLAASAASFIAQAADPGELSMASYSAMMIHDGEAFLYGNAAAFVKQAEELNRASDNIANIYADRSGKTASEMRDLMRAETWFYDQEAVDAGLADKVLDDGDSTEPVPQNSAKSPQGQLEEEFLGDLSKFDPIGNRKNKGPVDPEGFRSGADDETDWSTVSDILRSGLEGAEA